MAAAATTIGLIASYCQILLLLCLAVVDGLLSGGLKQVAGLPLQYGVNNETAAWNQYLCNTDNARLATIEDPSTMTKLIQALTPGDMWVGANDIQTEGLTRWVDSQVMTEADWGDGQPATANCMVYRKNIGKMEMADCNEQHYYLCETASTPLCVEGTGTGCLLPKDYTWALQSGMDFDMSVDGVKLVVFDSVNSLDDCRKLCAQKQASPPCRSLKHEGSACTLSNKADVILAPGSEVYQLTGIASSPVELALGPSPGTGRGDAGLRCPRIDATSEWKLATFRTFQDMANLKEFIWASGGVDSNEKVWIGLKRGLTANVHKFDDGTYPMETSWEGHPSPANAATVCVLMSSSGKLENAPCGDQHIFVCSKSSCDAPPGNSTDQWFVDIPPNCPPDGYPEPHLFPHRCTDISCAIVPDMTPDEYHLDIITGHAVYNLGGYAFFNCSQGYRTRDNTTDAQNVTCEVDTVADVRTAKWLIDSVADCLIDCLAPQAAAGFETLTITDTLEGDTATYRCPNGQAYDELDSYEAVLTCNSSGDWDGLKPTCTVATCLFPDFETTHLVLSDGSAPASSYVDQDTITVTCNDSYEFAVGVNYTIKCEATVFQDPPKQCLKSCGPPPDLVNASSVQYGQLEGSITYYVCDEVTTFVGGETFANVTCDNTGTWNLFTTQCIADCGAAIPANFTTISHTTGTTWNETASLTCHNVMKWPDGRDTYDITCQEHGCWTEPTMECVMDCGVPLLRANADAIYNFTWYNNSMVYQCKENYAYPDNTPNRTSQCQENGTWTDVVEECKRICVTPTTIPNGVFTQNGTLEGDMATYTCNNTYSLDNGEADMKAYCQDDGNWTELLPQCLKDCGPLNNLTHGKGKLDVAGISVENSTATYTCVEDSSSGVPKKYRFVGEESHSANMSIKCLASGEWEDFPNQCKIDCLTPDELMNGTYTVHNDTLEGDIARYTCEAPAFKFKLAGTTTMEKTCTSVGTWDLGGGSNSDFDCIVICGTPDATDNATVALDVAGKNTEGDTATYTCKDNYSTFVGDTVTVTCQNNTKWTEPEYYCVYDCGAAPDVTNANLASDGTLEGNTTTYIAANEYVFSDNTDNATSVCAEGGWPTVDPPKRVCPAPPTKSNATLVYEDPNQYIWEGLNITYTCQSLHWFPDQEVTSLTFICLPSGSWDTDPANSDCEMYCGEPAIKPKFNRTWTGVKVNDEATYVCQDGFRFLDNSTQEKVVSCGANGNWGKFSEDCIPDCGTPPPMEYAADPQFTDTLEGNDATYTCVTNYAFRGSSPNVVIRCTGAGTWAAFPEECVADCRQPNDLANATIPTPPNDNLENQNVTYTCKPRTTLIGSMDPMSTCQRNAIWSTPTEYCQVDCSDPMAELNGQVAKPDGTYHGAQAIHTCNTKYAFDDYSNEHTQDCGIDGFWNPTVLPAACVASCGAPDLYGNDEVAYNKTLLDEEAVYTCQSGYVFPSRTPNITVQCEAGSNWGTPGESCVADCGEPPAMIYAKHNRSGTTEGHVAWYECDMPVPRLNGSTINITCLSNTSWEDFPDKCIADCGEPIDYPNTIEVYESTFLNSPVYYYSRQGYELENATTLMVAICVDPGDWVGMPLTDAQVAMSIPCDDPPEVDKSEDFSEMSERLASQHYERFLDNEDRTFLPWSGKHFRSTTGSSFHDATTVRSSVCMPYGEWTHIEDCNTIWCPPLNGTPNILTPQRYEKPSAYGRKVTLRCKDGMLFTNGMAEWQTECGKTHQTTPVWSPAPHDSGCQPGRCGPLPYVRNATIEPYSSDGGTSANVTCFYGYRFSDGESMKQLQCLGDLTWEFKGHCYPDICERLEYPLNGNLTSQLALVFEKVVATCNEGYWFPQFSPKLFEYDIHCTHPLASTVTWDTQVQNCEIVDCEVPYTLAQCSQNYDTTTYLSLTNFTCEEGKRLEDGKTSVSIECMANGEWRDEPFFKKCDYGRCEPLRTLGNASTLDREALDGSNATYTCIEGHLFSDNSETHTVYCNGSSWNYTQDSCQIVHCPDWTGVAHGQLTGASNVYGSEADIVCDYGYAVHYERYLEEIVTIEGDIGEYLRSLIVANVTLTCTATKEWLDMDGNVVTPDVADTVCKRVPCEPPPHIEHGNYPNRNASVGDIRYYQCHRDYWMRRGVYDKTIECMASAKWSEPVKNCTLIMCQPVPIWTDLEAAHTKHSVRTVVEVWCGNNTKMVGRTPVNGTVFSECGQGGEWWPPLPECELIDEKPPVIPATEAPSAKAVGAIGIILISLEVAVCMILDLPLLKEGFMRYRDVIMMLKK